jgi:cyclic pyranopterin phosphate synthase
MVVMREWNFDELEDFVRFARRVPVEARFLELMPTRNTLNGSAGVDERSFVSVDEMRRAVEQAAELGPEEPLRGVARVFPLQGGLGKVGFISPVSNHFCASCNRIRLTATGGLKTCLHGEDIVDLRGPLREGASDDDLAGIVRDAVFRKPEEHFIRPMHYISAFLQMSQVGG